MARNRRNDSSQTPPPQAPPPEAPEVLQGNQPDEIETSAPPQENLAGQVWEAQISVPMLRTPFPQAGRVDTHLTRRQRCAARAVFDGLQARGGDAGRPGRSANGTATQWLLDRLADALEKFERA